MKIISVFKTHLDVGFTDLSADIMKGLCTDTLKRVIDVCERTANRDTDKKYIWTMSAWSLQYILDSEETDPNDKEKLISLIENNQVVWHALPYTVHTDFCGIDELIYGLQISKKLCERFHKTCVSAKMTDVPGHSRYLPTLLSAAGIKFLHLGCNPASTPPDVPILFWWEGPDGSRVLTMYMKDGYGSELTPSENWKYPVWLAMTMTNDNIGPHTADVLETMETEVAEYDSKAKFCCGTLDDFYYEILPFLDDSIPVIKSDLADSWIHGVGSYPEESAKIKQMRKETMAIQNLFTRTLSDHTDEKNEHDFSAAIDKIRENILLFDEHTWGCDIKLYLNDRVYHKEMFEKELESGKYSFPLLSWNEQRNRASVAKQSLQQAKDLLYKNLLPSNDTLLVYNGGSETGGFWIPVEAGKVYYDETADTKIATFSGVNGDEAYIPMMRNAEIRVLKETNGIAEKQNNVSVLKENGILKIKTPYHSAKFSMNDGTLIELTDCMSMHTWICNAKDFYRYDIFDDDDIKKFQQDYLSNPFDWALLDFGKGNYPADTVHQTFYPDFSHLDVAENGESVRVDLWYTADEVSRKKYGNAEKIHVIFTLYGYKPQIDIQCVIENKEATPYLESGHLILPLFDEMTDFSFDKLGNVIHPENDIIRDGNHALYCMDEFFHAQAGDCGMTVASNDLSLFSIGDIGILKFNHEYSTPKSNHVFFNLFNNQWGTNFPQWVGGTLSYSCTMITHSGNEETGIRLSKKLYDTPYVLKNCTAAHTDLPIALPPSLKVMRFEKTDPGIFWIVLKENAGSEVSMNFKASTCKEIYRSDLLRQKGDLIHQTELEVFRPWAIKSYLLVL